MSDNKSLVVEILSNVFEISEQKTESGKYKITGIKTSYKSDNDKVTVIGNIAVINISNFICDYVNRDEDTPFLIADEIEYNPDDFDLPVKYSITKMFTKSMVKSIKQTFLQLTVKKILFLEVYWQNS